MGRASRKKQDSSNSNPNTPVRGRGTPARGRGRGRGQGGRRSARQRIEEEFPPEEVTTQDTEALSQSDLVEVDDLAEVDEAELTRLLEEEEKAAAC